MRAQRALPFTLSDAAAARVRALMEQSSEPVAGLRIGVNAKGCSGLSYVMEYAKEKAPLEDEIEHKGVRIFIDPAAIMYLFGTEMDYEETTMSSGFVFRNPNETGRCGCGESFSVG